MFGTDTFLAAYARTAKDDDFSSLRFAVAGAEAVRAETRSIWRERFGAEIIEGFGLTEAAPVVAVNTAAHGRDGSVGRLLPGMTMRLEAVEGISEGGRLWLSGPNLMRGYMTADKPGELQPLAGRLARHRRHRVGRPRRLHRRSAAAPSASPRSPARWCRSAPWRCW